MSVHGHTYEKQLFKSKAFRHFVNIFTNNQTGITQGCEVEKTETTIKIKAGSFLIQGGFLEEEGGTELDIPTNAGYHILVYEIDLTQVNTKTEFNQGSYKFVSNLGSYPDLIQEDLDAEGNIYQFEFCRFRVTEEGVTDFQDTREQIDYGIYLKLNDIAEIVAYQTGAQIASQNATCKLQASKQVGEKFTLNNNEVVIGKGVNKVSVSAQIYFEYINSEQKYFSIRIMKNGALVAERLTEYKGNSFCCPTASFPIVDVQEGDKITLNFGDINDKQPTTRQGMTNTFLSVKAII